MIFEINFFLFYFAHSMISLYLLDYAQTYANITNSEYAVLGMILPALAIFAKPMSCSIADAKSIHRKFLIGSYAVYCISFGSLILLAFLKNPNDRDHDRIAWYMICALFCGGYVASCCVSCMNDALASNYARKNNLNYGKLRAWANLGWAAGGILTWSMGNVSWLPSRVPGLILLAISISIDISLFIFWPYTDDFEMFHDGSTVEQRKLSIVGPNTLAFMAQKKSRGSISKDILERIRAGRSKSVGNIPRTTDPIGHVTKQTPATECGEVKKYSNFQCQMILIKMIASKHKSFLRYIFLFTIFGMIQGIIWTFQFAFFKKEIVKGNENQYAKLTAIAIIVQSIGEATTNLAASEILRLFGSNAGMSLALVSIGLRCYYYSNVLPHLGLMSVILPELLQGPSLGLYWILIVDIGGNYALMVPDFMPELRERKIVRDRREEEELNGCLRASMIGAMSSSMEGLGVAVGSFIGGFISDSLGYYWLWNASALLSISLGFTNIGWDVATKLLFNVKRAQTQKRNNFALPTIVVDSNSNLRT